MEENIDNQRPGQLENGEIPAGLPPVIFALVVDGEVAGNLKLPNIPGTEKMIAIFQSDPKIIESSEEIPEGYIWDGINFNPPT